MAAPEAFNVLSGRFPASLLSVWLFATYNRVGCGPIHCCRRQCWVVTGLNVSTAMHASAHAHVRYSNLNRSWPQHLLLKLSSTLPVSCLPFRW